MTKPVEEDSLHHRHKTRYFTECRCALRRRRLLLARIHQLTENHPFTSDIALTNYWAPARCPTTRRKRANVGALPFRRAPTPCSAQARDFERRAQAGQRPLAGTRLL